MRKRKGKSTSQPYDGVAGTCYYKFYVKEWNKTKGREVEARASSSFMRKDFYNPASELWNKLYADAKYQYLYLYNIEDAYYDIHTKLSVEEIGLDGFVYSTNFYIPKRYRFRGRYYQGLYDVENDKLIRQKEKGKLIRWSSRKDL